MEHYIDKDALVAEIERRRDLHYKYYMKNGAGSIAECKYDEDKNILSFLDTLEVKEVDLEKEIDNYISNNFFGSETLGFFANRTKEEPNDQDIALCAKHFFELGVSCQVNNINMDEVKTAAKAWSEDDENTRGCDYIGAVVAERAFVACAEWLINKAQKGE